MGEQPAFIARADASTKLALDRTLLAYERTMLAWTRTATGLISFGFSIQQFFRVARQDSVRPERFFGPSEFGLLMIVIGLAALALAALQHRLAVQALKVQYPQAAGFSNIGRSQARVLAALIALLGLLALVFMFVRG